MLDIKFTQNENPVSAETAVVGQYTNYMFCMQHRTEGGWIFPRVIPTGTYKILPTSPAVRQGLCAVDSMRITRDINGKSVLFRPDFVMRRLSESARKLSLPEPETDILTEALKRLCTLESEFFEYHDLLVADLTLLREDARNCCITVSLRVDKSDAAPLSLMSEKAPIINSALSSGMICACESANERAKMFEYGGVLWLDTVYGKYILEASGRNIFFRAGDTLITPDSPIVNGVMRDCVIRLADSWGINVSVRPITTDELLNLEISEMFATSQKDGIVPVTEILIGSKTVSAKSGKLTRKLSDTVSNIESGRMPAPERWAIRI